MSLPLAVEFSSVSKRYADHVAVSALTLGVPEGSVYGFLGPNGAGKTTSIRMLLNILAPDTGSIRIFGVPSTERGITDRIGYLPEERGLYRKMRVRRVLRFLAALKGVRGRDADRRIDFWLERFDLRGSGRDWGTAKVDELSRGMQQKVQFIGTLLHDPELIVLDEPFSGLDPINAQALKDTVIDLKRKGRTVIFSTHMMDNAERICDAVCIIARGEKVLDGELGEVRSTFGGQHVALALSNGLSAPIRTILGDRQLVRRVDDSNRFFEVELADGADPQLLLRRILDSGAAVSRFELIQPSLHQIFLHRVGAHGVEEGISGQG